VNKDEYINTSGRGYFGRKATTVSVCDNVASCAVNLDYASSAWIGRCL